MHDRQILDARLQKSEIPGTYSRVARVYDTWGRLTESKARHRSLDLAAIRDGESVLEVAVGTGLAFAEILKANPTGRNVGIDLTEAMLTHARQKASAIDGANPELLIGDAYHLEFPDESFDVLVNHYMFDLLPEGDFRRVLSGFHRVLRPGGRLALVNMTLPATWYESIWRGVYRIYPKAMGGCRGVRLAPHLNQLEFEIVRIEHVSQLTFPSEVILAVKPRGLDGTPNDDSVGRLQREAATNGSYEESASPDHHAHSA